MKPRGWVGGFHEACQWVYRLALLNLWWLGGCLLGGLVFGFFPATVAMFDVARFWMRTAGDEGDSAFRRFRTAYRTEFFRANALGLGLVLAGYVLFVDVNFFLGQSGPLALTLLVLSLALSGVYCMTLIYLFPVYVHLDLPWRQQIMTAALVGLSHPFRTAFVVLAAVSLSAVFARLPGLFVFFGGSVLACFVVWQTLRIFDRQAAQRRTAHPGRPAPEPFERALVVAAQPQGGPHPLRGEDAASDQEHRRHGPGLRRPADGRSDHSHQQ